MIDTLPGSLISALIEESLDAVLIIDEACLIRYVNHAMQTLSGYPKADLLAHPLDLLLPGAMAALHTEYVHRFTAGAKPSAVLGQVREFAIRHRSGKLIPIEMKALDLGMHEGTRYFGAFIEDLRDRRRLEERHAALLARLEQQAMTDPLTDIANRRAFEEEAAQMMARAQRSGSLVAVGIADIDRFKEINDAHGHPVGDVVLREVARRMVQAARATDLVARIGGEEFGLLFPDTAADAAMAVAQRIREAICAAPVCIEQDMQLPTSLSIGLATLVPGMALEEALASADCALYNAKNSGRNRVERS
jgi:diguanylate cyclase (GGDEF)-like protein/PAS domain S-box-containing protein